MEQVRKQTSGIKELKRKAKKNLRKFIRFATVKIVYPIVYTANKGKKVNDRLVLFVEPTSLQPTNSIRKMMEEVQSCDDYDVEFMSLGHNRVRKRHEIDRDIKFLKQLPTARFVFTTEALPTVGGCKVKPETQIINLWHGCGAFKRFGISTAAYEFGDNLKIKRRYPDYSNLSLITVSSPEVVWAYEEAMDYQGKDVVQATGISRTDVFFDEQYIQAARDKVATTIPEIGDRKIILYAPTFRGHVKTAKSPDEMDIERMAKEFGKDYVLLINHHPHVKERPEIPAACKNFAWDVTGQLTIEDLICTADICISDYSSMVFEYSLFEKPMLFYAFDLDEYNDWRGFYYSYDELTPGPIVRTNDEIIDFIKHIDKKYDKSQVVAFKNKFMDACDGKASDRILKWMQAQ